MAVPSAALGFEQVPVAGSQVPTVWHWSAAVQVTGLPPVQTPAWQVSVWDRESVVLGEGVDLGGGLVIEKKAGSQVPTVWHWSAAGQVTGLLPVQTPAWQVGVWVKASVSLPAVPSAALGFEQVPVAGSQVPTVWH